MAASLFINGTLVVDNDGLHATQERSGSIDLVAGNHSIVVTFFERYGAEVLEVLYQGPRSQQTGDSRYGLIPSRRRTAGSGEHTT